MAATRVGQALDAAARGRLAHPGGAVVVVEAPHALQGGRALRGCGRTVAIVEARDARLGEGLADGRGTRARSPACLASVGALVGSAQVAARTQVPASIVRSELQNAHVDQVAIGSGVGGPSIGEGPVVRQRNASPYGGVPRTPSRARGVSAASGDQEHGR